MLDNVDSAAAIPAHVRHVEDDLRHVVVMNTQSGEIFALDNSAAVIWNALASSGATDVAAAALVERYGISHERAVHDVRGFVQRLVRAKLLTPGG